MPFYPRPAARSNRDLSGTTPAPGPRTPGLLLAGSQRLGQDLRAEIDLMRTLKRAIDPDNILNPGKILPD